MDINNLRLSCYEDLEIFDSYLENNSYISGYIFSLKDIEFFYKISKENLKDLKKYSNISRWYNHIASFPELKSNKVAVNEPKIMTKPNAGQSNKKKGEKEV